MLMRDKKMYAFLYTHNKVERLYGVTIYRNEAKNYVLHEPAV